MSQSALLAEYQAFLSTKHPTAQPTGFTIAPERISPRLFRFEADIVRWALHLGRAAIFAEAGLGKTLMQLEWARHVAAHTGGKVLILAPLAVAPQTVREGVKFGIDVKHIEDQSQVGDASIVVTNYDSVNKFDPNDFTAIVLDECFSPDTLIDVVVDGEIIQKPIYLVKEGDHIVNAQGIDVVADVHRREVPYAIKVKFAGETIITSPNHPWFTQRGWVGAQDLRPGDYFVQTASAMRMVRDGVYPEIYSSEVSEILRAILLGEMANETTGAYSKGSRTGSCTETGRSTEEMVRGWQRGGAQSEAAYGRFEFYAQRRIADEALPHIESNGAQTLRAWGEWDWIDEAAIRDAQGIRRQLAGGICFITGQTDSRLSDALQNRLSQRRAKNSHRSGWTLPQIEKDAGSEEGAKADFIRVDGIEVLELGHSELDSYRDAEGKLYFYDLGATRHPSFSVSGVLVHNSSVLKHYSKTFFHMNDLFKNTQYKLCCTATPSPNDYVELGNHAMFLDVMHFKDMLARWFVGEGDVARSARLKGHGADDFWRWLTSWAVCLSKPRDLGEEYDMPGYDLPTLHVHDHRLGVNQATIDRAWKSGKLLADDSPSATGFMKVKRETMPDRVVKVAEIVASIPADQPIIVWCDTDFEADALLKVLPEAETVEVRGSQTRDRKESWLNDFSEGRKRIIVSKPQLAGFGLNWQHCHHMIFAGVSFSFERTYQAIKRIHRFGQEHECHVHMIYAESEGNVMELLKAKQDAFAIMQAQMSAAIREHGLFRDGKIKTIYSEAEMTKEAGQGWTYYQGDCVTTMPILDKDSVDLTVTSIPFSNLYIYSDSQADVGNAGDEEEFFEHMAFVIRELLRITKPGRCAAIHVKDLPLFQNRDGVMGINPFSDTTVAAFRDTAICDKCNWIGSPKGRKGVCPECKAEGALGPGWTLQSRITIWKDPVIEMEKTNSHGLLFKNWRERAELLRVGLPDYVLIFQKPGDAPENRVTHDRLDITYHGENPPADYRYPYLPSRRSGDLNIALPIWQDYASPTWDDVSIPAVWNDIQQTKVLNYMIAKSDKDTRHLCPLQLDLIARLVHFKSNPGDVVFDPFGGVASTGYEALKMGRKFIGVELKPEYHALGIRYLKEAEIQSNAPTLESMVVDATRPQESLAEVLAARRKALAAKKAAEVEVAVSPLGESTPELEAVPG